VSTLVPRPTDPGTGARLARELRIHPITAQVLLGRGISTAEEARSFLRPDLSSLHDPTRLQDLEAAAERIEHAIARGDRIAVYGDYDVDGVCSTVVMTRMLEALGADVRPYIPHRVTDGYGLNGEALGRLREEGCGLVVTVDNGITRADEVAAAMASGLDIVITDHHEPDAHMPGCPVVNPKRHDATYPFAGLAGCGVAFKVACGLAERRGDGFAQQFKDLLPNLLATVAIGTIADVVPLLDENRILVRGGLAALAGTRHAGLRALLRVSRCEGRKLRASDIGFRIGPRINAAGRLGSAQLALDLLLSEDTEAADGMARELDGCNRERQRIERQHATDAYAQAEAMLADAERAGEDLPAFVIAGDDWHPGVIGIVAARVAERFGKPAALIAVDNTEGREEGRGSARSHGDVRLHEALAACTEHLVSHGGHALAAGFTLKPDRIDAFRSAFVDAIRNQPTDGSATRIVDAEMPLDAIHRSLAAEIALLQPFGAANQEPIFCALGVKVAGKPRRVGSDGQHLVFYAAGDRASWRAVAFNQADRAPLLEDRVDIAFSLRQRDDPEGVELHVREIHAAG
jgi:single-stranded-DNA-specific exonuclease